MAAVPLRTTPSSNRIDPFPHSLSRTDALRGRLADKSVHMRAVAQHLELSGSEAFTLRMNRLRDTKRCQPWHGSVHDAPAHFGQRCLLLPSPRRPMNVTPLRICLRTDVSPSRWIAMSGRSAVRLPLIFVPRIDSSANGAGGSPKDGPTRATETNCGSSNRLRIAAIHRLGWSRVDFLLFQHGTMRTRQK